jgi:hypothetical protein
LKRTRVHSSHDSSDCASVLHHRHPRHACLLPRQARLRVPRNYWTHTFWSKMPMRFMPSTQARVWRLRGNLATCHGGGASLWSRIATGDCWPSARTCNAFPRLGLQKLAGQPSAVQCIAGPAPQDSAFAPPSGWTASLMRLQAKLARLLLQGLKPEFYLRPYGTT